MSYTQVLLQILLDFTYDCSVNCCEPTLAIQSEETSQKTINTEDLGKKLSSIDLNTTNARIFQSTVTDDDESTDNLNDFHLAEINLMECLLRTNILQRIK